MFWTTVHSFSKTHIVVCLWFLHLFMLSIIHFERYFIVKNSILNGFFHNKCCLYWRKCIFNDKSALWMVSWMVFVVENAFERHLSLKMWTLRLAYLFVVCWCFMFYSEEIRRKDNEMCKVRDRPPCISNILSGWKIRKSTDNHGSWIQM